MGETEPKNTAASKAAADPDWRALICDVPEPAVVRAQVYLQARSSASKPIEVECSDGNRYWVKGLRCDKQSNGNPAQPDQPRMMFTEQVVGRIAAILGAPVPAVGLVQISAGLIAANPSMNHLIECKAHASRSLVGVSERIDGIAHVEENRIRFAALAILYAWVGSGDRQFLYENAAPHHVYSVDHGHLPHGGPGWSVASLTGAPEVAVPTDLRDVCALTPEILAPVVRRLEVATPEVIAKIVGMRPSGWTVPDDDCIAFGRYLLVRRNKLMELYPKQDQKNEAAV